MVDLTTVGRTCEVGDGTHSKISRQDSGVLYLTSRNFKDGQLDLNQVYYISEQDYAKHFIGGGTALAKPEKDDLVFSIIGTIGQPYLIKDSDRFGISSSVAIVRPNKSQIYPRFLYYWVRGPVFQNALLGIRGGVAQGYVSLEMIRSLPVPTISLLVQNRIAGILSAYDNLIENNLRRVRILEEMARSIYREWFVHFRFPDHERLPLVDSPLGPIPQGWEIAEFRSLFDIKYGKTLPKSEIAAEGDYPVYGAGDVIGFYDKALCPSKCVLVTSRGNGSGTVWRTREAAFVTNNSLIILPQVKFGHWDYSFVELLLKHSNVMGARTGSAQPQVTIENLNYVKAIVPQRTLVENFCSFATPVCEQVDLLLQMSANLRSTRDLLLPRLLSGTIDISHTVATRSLASEVEPADELVAEIQERFESITATTNDSHSSKVAFPMAAGVETSSKSYTPQQPRGQLELGCELPPPIDQTDRSHALAAIRQVFSDGKPRTREDAIREVARALGYGRTGHRIQDVLRTDLLTAVRRGILDNVEDELILLARSIAGYDRDFLKQQFLAAIGRSWIERDDAIQNFCRWMGFRRTGQIIDETARSVINGLLRESRLEANGPNLIRRTS